MFRGTMHFILAFVTLLLFASVASAGVVEKKASLGGFDGFVEEHKNVIKI